MGHVNAEDAFERFGVAGFGGNGFDTRRVISSPGELDEIGFQLREFGAAQEVLDDQITVLRIEIGLVVRPWKRRGVVAHRIVLVSPLLHITISIARN